VARHTPPPQASRSRSSPPASSAAVAHAASTARPAHGPMGRRPGSCWPTWRCCRKRGGGTRARAAVAAEAAGCSSL